MKMNDPIQEDSLKIEIEEMKEKLYNNSNDLSDEGSIKEEIGTIKRKKISLFTSCLIIFIFFAICIESSKLLEDKIQEVNEFYDVDTNAEKFYFEEIEKQENIFLDLKKNIKINTSILSDTSIVLEVLNQNDRIFNNVKIQTIFYDGENIPIKICENNVNTLFENGRYLCKIYDAPKGYERFEFLITQPYIIQHDNIDYSQLLLTIKENKDGDFKATIKNNSTKKIDYAEIAIIYYKNGNIVELQQDTVFDIGSRKAESSDIYNFQEIDTYDDIKFIINDVYIYE